MMVSPSRPLTMGIANDSGDCESDIASASEINSHTLSDIGII